MTFELRRVILINSLININDRANEWKKINVYNEHFNDEMKTIFKNRVNFICDFNHVHKYIAFNSTFLKKLKQFN